MAQFLQNSFVIDSFFPQLWQHNFWRSANEGWKPPDFGLHSENLKHLGSYLVIFWRQTALKTNSWNLKIIHLNFGISFCKPPSFGFEASFQVFFVLSITWMMMTSSRWRECKTSKTDDIWFAAETMGSSENVWKQQIWVPDLGANISAPNGTLEDDDFLIPVWWDMLAPWSVHPWKING